MYDYIMMADGEKQRYRSIIVKISHIPFDLKIPSANCFVGKFPTTNFAVQL